MLNSRLRLLAGLSGFCLAACAPGSAQNSALLASAADAPALSSSSLPDAPSALAVPAAPEGFTGAGQSGILSNEPIAGPYAMVIHPGQTAPKISKRTEVVAGIRDAFSPASILGWGASEGYSYVTNGSPNYPQTGKGFAQGLGAAAARDTSETIFSESILGPILHEDSRYYRMGDGHNFVVRLFYAGTREIFTRTDGGHQTLNLASLGGNLAGSALTQAYYPTLNRGGTEVLKTFGGSVGGSALGYVIDEFLPDIFRHKK